MAKIKWNIVDPDYGSQGIIVASTRIDAIALAEANHQRRNNSYGEFNPKTPIPAFTAIKVTQVTPRHFDFFFD